LSSAIGQKFNDIKRRGKPKLPEADRSRRSERRDEKRNIVGGKEKLISGGEAACGKRFGGKRGFKVGVYVGPGENTRRGTGAAWIKFARRKRPLHRSPFPPIGGEEGKIS